MDESFSLLELVRLIDNGWRRRKAAIVAAQIRFVRNRYRADPRRVMAMGISAGAALAAVLGVQLRGTCGPW
jgi:hypothetical protein